MPRYVDVDKAYEIARTHHKDFARSMADLTSLREVLEDALEDTPTADVVEVVRCKDCVYRDTGDCDIQTEYRKYAEYCSFGTKKDLKV